MRDLPRQLLTPRTPQLPTGEPPVPRAAARDAAAFCHCFRSGHANRILGVSHRPLHHSVRTGLVVPSTRTGGGPRCDTFEDRAALRAASQWIDAGVSAPRIRRGTGALGRSLPAACSTRADA